MDIFYFEVEFVRIIYIAVGKLDKLTQKRVKIKNCCVTDFGDFIIIL